jgi:hypothetical protein
VEERGVRRGCVAKNEQGMPMTVPEHVRRRRRLAPRTTALRTRAGRCARTACARPPGRRCAHCRRSAGADWRTVVAGRLPEMEARRRDLDGAAGKGGSA